MSGAVIDRGKMNMPAPFATDNTHSRLRIPGPGSIIGIGSAPMAAALPAPAPLSRREVYVATLNDVRIRVRELKPARLWRF
jgi:hypothetical protein